jgi:mono/diheme cytochrome c family protein
MKRIYLYRNKHVILQVLAFSLAVIFTSCSPESSKPQAVVQPDVDIDSLLHQGEDLYAQSCSVCHYGGDGGGQNPALIGSITVKGPTEDLVKVILHGQKGVSLVNGKKLNGIMPAQAYLSDVEVAAIATYVRQEYGKLTDAVQPSLVAKVRASP